MKNEYYLKYKDEKVLVFDTENQAVEILNESLLPISISKAPVSYDIVRSFCSNRLLMMNREYCKEILDFCGIYDQSDVNICIVSRALSFRDNYWICHFLSQETWSGVNLYHNPFSKKIAKVSLTGEVDSSVDLNDKIYTGELSNKGTRAKCFYRQGESLFLIKAETNDEIASELVSSSIASSLGIECGTYIKKGMWDRNCSVCAIWTSEVNELIPARDIMLCYGEQTTSVKGNYFKHFMDMDPVGFLKMMIFDYITLNTDRNRDNFGLLRHNGEITSMYPLFDHDSCFKGKSTKGIYFPTGLNFARTRDEVLLINPKTNKIAQKAYDSLADERYKAYFVQLKGLENYEGMLKRLQQLM